MIEDSVNKLQEKISEERQIINKNLLEIEKKFEQ